MSRLARALLEAEPVDPRQFIMQGPKSVREVCENYGLKFIQQRYPNKHEAGFDFSETHVDYYSGVYRLPRKIWHSPIAKYHFSSDELREQPLPGDRYTSPYIQGIYISLRHEVDEGGAVPHFINITLNRTYLWDWRRTTNTEQEMADILERDFFKRLDTFVRSFRGFSTDDLYLGLRRAKVLVKNA